MPPLLVARDLGKSYLAGHGRCWARVQVLASVSLSLGVGERLLIAGGPRSGKTTLLHCLTGLRRPDRGSVRWDASRGTPYRLCADPDDLSAVGPRSAALIELPRDPYLAIAWMEALHAARCSGTAWLVLGTRSAPLMLLADRVLELHEGRLVPFDATRGRRVAESARQ